MKPHLLLSEHYRFLFIGLAVLLALATTWSIECRAQAAAGAPQAAAASKLKIVIVGGEEPLRNLKQRVQREVIVEVRDENDKPVGGGAIVSYTLASRPGQGTALGSVITGADGRAALNFTPTATGSANMNITAALGSQTGAIAVPVNVAGSLAAAAAAVGTTAVATAGTVAQTTVATQDCNGLFDVSSLTMTDQVCSGAVSPNTSPQCMSAVQKLLTQFSQLCSCVGGISVPQLYTQYGISSSDIDAISSHAKTVGFSLPPSCTSPNAPTTIRIGPPGVGPPQ